MTDSDEKLNVKMWLFLVLKLIHCSHEVVQRLN